jgi:hypothetical protein
MYRLYMKLVIIGLIILLVFINLNLLLRFRKEGLVENNKKPNMMIDGFNRVSNFLAFDKVEKKREDIEKEKSMKDFKNNINFRPGNRIASLPLYDGKDKNVNSLIKKQQKALYYERGFAYDNDKPFSFVKEQKIIDDNAGQSGTGGSSAEDPKNCDESDPITGERCKASKERAEGDRLLKLGNVVEVDFNGPIYEAASYTSHKSNTLDDVISACVNNNWKTRKLTYQEINSKNLKNKGGFGWNKKPLESKPCIGFWNEKNNPEKYHILVPCENDCDKLDVTPIKIEEGVMPAEGETFYPGSPSDNVGRVWRIISGIGANSSMARSDLSGKFRELKTGEEIKNLEIASKSLEGDTFLQAANRCAQKKGRIPNKQGNPCVGMVKKKDDDKYYFLYKALGSYEPGSSEGGDIDYVYRKLKGSKINDDIYTSVNKGNPIRNVSSILKDQYTEKDYVVETEAKDLVENKLQRQREKEDDKLEKVEKEEKEETSLNPQTVSQKEETEKAPITAGEDVTTFETCNELREKMWNDEGHPMSKSQCKKAKELNCSFIAHTECGCASWDNLKYSNVGKCDSVEIKSQGDDLKQATEKKNVYFLINSGANRRYTLETKNAEKVHVYVGSGNGNSLKIKYTGKEAPDVVQHIGSGEGLRKYVPFEEEKCENYVLGKVCVEKAPTEWREPASDDYTIVTSGKCVEIINEGECSEYANNRQKKFRPGYYTGLAQGCNNYWNGTGYEFFYNKYGEDPGQNDEDNASCTAENYCICRK